MPLSSRPQFPFLYSDGAVALEAALYRVNAAMEDDPGLKKNRPSLTNCSNRFQILTQNRLRSPVAAAMLLLLCVFFASSASAAKPPTSANGTRTVEGKLNALINGALSLPVSGERRREKC